MQLRAGHWPKGREEIFWASGRAVMQTFWSMPRFHEGVLITDGINLPRKNFLGSSKAVLTLFVNAFSLSSFIHMLPCQEKQSVKRKYELLNSVLCTQRFSNLIEVEWYWPHSLQIHWKPHKRLSAPLFTRAFWKRHIYCCAERETETGENNSLLS